MCLRFQLITFTFSLYSTDIFNEILRQLVNTEINDKFLSIPLTVLASNMERFRYHPHVLLFGAMSRMREGLPGCMPLNCQSLISSWDIQPLCLSPAFSERRAHVNFYYFPPLSVSQPPLLHLLLHLHCPS